MAAAPPLTEACRPRTSLGALFSYTDVACLRAWLASGQAGPALATAPSGSGLTTLVTLLLNELALDPVWVGVATPRVKQLLAHAGGSPLSVTMRRKVIVVDEFDAISGGGDSLARSDVLAFARAKPPLPVLLLAHSTRSQKTHEFAKAWPRFAFRRPADKALEDYLALVAGKHGVPVDEAAVRQLAREARGDVRAALLALDMRRRGAPAAAGCDFKDEAIEGLDLTEAVLRGQRGAGVADCLKMFHMEPAVLPMGVFENYLPSLDRRDIPAAAAVADAFAAADCVDQYINSRQAWDLYEAYGALAVAAPVMEMRRLRVGRPSPALAVTKFGSTWSKAYNLCAKRKALRALNHKYAAAGLQRRTVTDLALLRAALRAALERGDDDAVRSLCFPLSPADVLCAVRFDVPGSAWYKPALHARVKRLLAGAGG